MLLLGTYYQVLLGTKYLVLILGTARLSAGPSDRSSARPSARPSAFIKALRP